MRHFLSYWKPEIAKDHIGKVVMNHSGSEQFSKVSRGDTVWVCTCFPDGHFSLLGCIPVSLSGNQEEAAKAMGIDPQELWFARYHIVGDPNETEMVRDVDITDLAPQLRFISKTGANTLKLVNSRVQAQQLQRMRELTPESAVLLSQRLDKVIQEGH